MSQESDRTKPPRSEVDPRWSSPVSESDLWNRLRDLEDRVIYSISSGRPSLVTKVTANAALRSHPETGKGMTPARRDQVMTMYRLLLSQGSIIQRDLDLQLGPAVERKNGRFILAILAAALPDTVETFISDRRIGIRLRRVS